MPNINNTLISIVLVSSTANLTYFIYQTSQIRQKEWKHETIRHDDEMEHLKKMETDLKETQKLKESLRRISNPLAGETFRPIAFRDPIAWKAANDRATSGNPDYQDEVKYWRNFLTEKKDIRETGTTYHISSYPYTERSQTVRDATLLTCAALETLGWEVTRCAVKQTNPWEHHVQIDGDRSE